MPVCGSNGVAARAVGEDVRRSLEDVPVDSLDLLALAAARQSQKDFLRQILAVALELRRTPFEEPRQRAAITRCQCLNKTLLAPICTWGGRRPVRGDAQQHWRSKWRVSLSRIAERPAGVL